MSDVRRYGSAPFRVALVHGGPGAPGEMAPLARELSADRGVLEPLQGAASLEGQVRELKAALEDEGHPPVTLIGHSWGAMLSFILAARYPALVGKLILVGSGPFAEEYAADITSTRLRRLSEEKKRQARVLMEALTDPHAPDKSAPFARLGKLLAEADSCDPLTLDSEALAYQYEINQSVWSEARELRAHGELLALAERIRCPVVAIHGDYDPHPAEGVERPLAAVLSDFKFFLLRHCGHQPWIERRARDDFFGLLRQQLT